MAQQHPDVRDYLKRLEQALAGTPRERRQEIVGEIEAHIHQELSALDREPLDRDVADVLEGLGDPEAIAAAEVGDVPDRRRRSTALEVAALILLLVGAFVLPLIGWVVGVVLLWISPAWTSREKWLGTLVVPGGLGLPVYLLLFAGGQSVTCSVGPTSFKFLPDGTSKKIEGPTICETAGLSRPLMTVIVIILAIAAIATVVYLGRKVRTTATS